FELRESKVNAGNQCIKALLGVNTKQFRKLFILPKGKFKRYIKSKSIEKQEILIILLNSQRFEEIQAMLNNDVKEVKEQIKKRYINARQTNKNKYVLPEIKIISETIQNDLNAKRDKCKETFEKIERQLNTNLKLQEAMTNLEQKQTEYNKLLSEENNIQNQ